MTNLTIIQKQILKAIQQMSQKNLITESHIAKKIRENSKIQNKKKAVIGVIDLEVVLIFLAEQDNVNYSMYSNSANDIFIKKTEELKLLDSEVRSRRLKAEHSMSLFSQKDFL